MPQLFVGPETARILRAGALGEHVDGFAEALRLAGYAPASIEDKVVLAAQLGRWLKNRGLVVRDLNEDRFGGFLRDRGRRYRARRGATRHSSSCCATCERAVRRHRLSWWSSATQPR